MKLPKRRIYLKNEPTYTYKVVLLAYQFPSIFSAPKYIDTEALKKQYEINYNTILSKQ